MNDIHLKQVRVWEGRTDRGDPIFPSNSARIPAEDAQAVVDYLVNAPIVVRTTALKRDAISGQDAVVPQSIRSDGEWVWSDEVAYYVEKYLVKPNDEFLAFVKSHPTPPTELTEDTYSRITSELGL